jgi:hypothetical protein
MFPPCRGRSPANRFSPLAQPDLAEAVEDKSFSSWTGARSALNELVVRLLPPRGRARRL